jgi:SAM-dependent methyltransferase
MIRELGHFLWHAPATLRLKRRLPQDELYQVVMQRWGAAGLDARRAELVGDLTGEILEIGAGTGLMFPHYGPAAQVTAIEPDAAFSAHARELAGRVPARIEVVDGHGESLPFANARFDAAVLTLVLCSVTSEQAVLGELRRVLRPGGTVRLIEHVRSPRRVAGWLMDRFDGVWLRLNAQGCHMNRDPVAALAAAGFEVTRVDPFQIYSPGLPAFPLRMLEARAPSAPPSLA